jgi:hypothetical protein
MTPNDTLGITLAVVLALVAVVVLVRHAIHPDTQVDRSSFVRGMVVMGLGFTALFLVPMPQGSTPSANPGVPNTAGDRVREFFMGMIRMLDVFGQPDWMGTEWNARILWGLLAVVAYAFLAVGKVLPWHNRQFRLVRVESSGGGTVTNTGNRPPQPNRKKPSTAGAQRQSGVA